MKIRTIVLQVCVSPKEKAAIALSARTAGLSVSRYLRSVGLGYQLKSVTNFETVREIIKVSSDCHKLERLLTKWSEGEFPALTPGAINAAIAQIIVNQNKLQNLIPQVMKAADTSS